LPFKAIAASSFRGCDRGHAESDIFRGELRQDFGIDIIVAERRRIPFEIEFSRRL
jgi:hypothetical protein